MQSTKYNARRKALVYALSFVIYTVLITCIFQFWSVFLASYILVLTIISGILYVLVSKCNQPVSQATSILDLKDFKSISMLLRYATAVLSFISLMTTARGLKDFVFSDNEGWMAYLASFAVQAILICFSLTYCHIHTAIRSVTTLSARGKSLMTGILSIFLAISFVISSSFSFSYIANNAYAQTWANDGEIMIEKYLTQSISDLATENKRIGNLLFEKIKIYNESLSNTVKEYIATQDETFVNTVTAFTLPAYSLTSDGSDHGYGLNEPIINSWNQRYSTRAIEISGLVSQFDSCVTSLNSYCITYNQIVGAFDINDDAISADWVSVDLALDTTYNELNTLNKSLSSLIERCNNLYISTINLDISPYRASLSTAVTDFSNFVATQMKNVNSLRREVQDAVNGYSANIKGNPLSEEIETLQKKIYMLNANHDSNSSETIAANVDDIINGLADILVTYLNTDVLSNETIMEILELETLVADYQNYINLADEIEEFSDSRLSITYNITKTATVPSNPSGSVINVTYDQWISLRDQDFLQLFSLLKKLPVKPDLEGTAETRNSNTKYTTEDVLSESNILRRDLLGSITDFERAFSYFKYDFKAMAFFSAFIAAFFDLGAFLTGCFLYGIKHFEKKVAGV